MCVSSPQILCVGEAGLPLFLHLFLTCRQASKASTAFNVQLFDDLQEGDTTLDASYSFLGGLLAFYAFFSTVRRTGSYEE